MTILLTNIFLFLNQYIELLKMRIHYNQYSYLQKWDACIDNFPSNRKLQFDVNLIIILCLDYHNIQKTEHYGEKRLSQKWKI